MAKYFKIEMIVTGCINCPHSTDVSWCDINTVSETPEEFAKIFIENEYNITPTCTMYEEAKDA